MKKKGISLIVLVITIVVIIILAAAVILSLGKNNPINSAKEAKVKTTIDNLKSDLLMSISKITADSLGQIDVTQIDAPGEKYEVVDLIPSIKGTEYENELVVIDGKIKVKDGTTLPQETKKEVMELLDQTVTAEKIKNAPQKYIGKTVTYTGYNESTNTIDWRLFGFDENGNIMLRANDYVNLSYKGTTPATGINVNGYALYSSSNRDTLIDYLGTSSNWDEYAVFGKTEARGTMTIEEFVSCYNLVNIEKLEVKNVNAGETFPDDNSIIAGYDGYIIKKGDEKYNWFKYGLVESYNHMKYYYGGNDKKANGIWLSSKLAGRSDGIACIYFDGGLSGDGYATTNLGIFPTVSLTSAVLVEKNDGTLVVE